MRRGFMAAAVSCERRILKLLHMWISSDRIIYSQLYSCDTAVPGT